VAFSIRQPEYYAYVGSALPLQRGVGRWEPWGATNVVKLKPILNPIAMIQGQMETRIPKFGQPVGFDLLKSDWVSPHGKGLHSDFVITVTNRYTSDIDRDLMVDLRVAGPLAGLLPLKTDLRRGSELKTPHQAPPDGYEPEHPIWSFVGTTNGERFTRQNFEPASGTQAYLFRIRTEVDEQGRLKNAYYGKILGELEALHGGVDNVLFRMSYFINPESNDRNIEHDHEKLVPVGSPGAVLK
jgi:hypothetical protein